jgi:hypothetical protein
MQVFWGRADIACTSSLPRQQMEVSGRDALAALPSWKGRRFPLGRGLGGPHSGSEGRGYKKSHFAPPGIRTPVVQSVVRRCTGRVSPIHVMVIHKQKEQNKWWQIRNIPFFKFPVSVVFSVYIHVFTRCFQYKARNTATYSAPVPATYCLYLIQHLPTSNQLQFVTFWSLSFASKASQSRWRQYRTISMVTKLDYLIFAQKLT